MQTICCSQPGVLEGQLSNGLQSKLRDWLNGLKHLRNSADMGPSLAWTMIRNLSHPNDAAVKELNDMQMKIGLRECVTTNQGCHGAQRELNDIANVIHPNVRIFLGGWEPTKQDKHGQIACDETMTVKQ